MLCLFVVQFFHPHRGGPGSLLRVVAEASGELRKSQIYTAAIDCEDRLPDSGKTIYERFGFKRSLSAPLVMLTGNGQPTRQIDAEKLEVRQMLHYHREV
jgi:hypothetical protein